MDQYVLQCFGLTKQFGNKIAVNNLGLTVKKGDIYGFIGPNGAGKTTAMKLMLGLLRPNSGTVSFFGNPFSYNDLTKVGSLIEAPGLFKNCTVFENMKRFAILTDSRDAEIYELLRLVGLQDAVKLKVKALSLGMKQRLGIAVSLLGAPELMILDEPVNGLDPMGMKDMREIITTINKQHGVSFLISSHLLGELEKISTVYGIINYGILTREITADELQKKCIGSVFFRCSDPPAAIQLINDKLNIGGITVDGNYIVIPVEASRSAEINKTLVFGGIDVFEQGVRSVSAEDYLLQYMTPVNV